MKKTNPYARELRRRRYHQRIVPNKVPLDDEAIDPECVDCGAELASASDSYLCNSCRKLEKR